MNAGQTRSERGIGGRGAGLAARSGIGGAERDWQRGAELGGAGGIWRRGAGLAGAGGIWRRGAGLAGAGGIYSFRPFGAPLPYIGLPQRFCEAKDLWEEGEQVFSWQRHGVALTTCELGNGTWSVQFPDRARFLPRETSEHRSKAASKTSGLRNLLRCDEEARERREAPTTTPSVSLRSTPPSKREARKGNSEKASPGRRGRKII